MKKVEARFYKSPGGSEPVRDWLLGLEREDRRIIGFDIATAEYGWPIGMPTCRAMGGGLFEIRSSLPGKRIARILLCHARGKLVLLHGFLKKTQKTPTGDLDLARTRMKEIVK